MVKFVNYILENVGVKFNAHKLKKIIDFNFVVIEKVIVRLVKLYPVYLDFYEGIVLNEVILAGITRSDRILHIGCGPIPATSILLVRKTQANVTGIDINQSSVKQAQKLVVMSNLQDVIQIKHADAKDFSVSNFDIIVISQGVKPYDKILNNISKEMKKDAKVIFRTSSTPTGEISQKDLFLKDIFKIERIVAQKKNATLISVLLLKK